MSLLESCRELVKNNIKNELDSDTIDIISLSVLGLVLIKGEQIIKKMPVILQGLDIYASEESVLDMVHEKINNYQEDDFLSSSNATVTSAFQIDEDGNFYEKKFMFICLKGKTTYEKTRLVTHEFLHLLRSFISKIENNKLIKKSGIAIDTFDFSTNTSKRKHYNFEDSIVEFYAKEACEEITRYVDTDNNEVYRSFMSSYAPNIFTGYELQLALMELLTKDRTFVELLDKTFEEETSKELAAHFNKVMGSPTEFTSFSKTLDKMIDEATDDKTFESCFEYLTTKATQYVSKSKKIAPKKEKI